PQKTAERIRKAKNEDNKKSSVRAQVSRQHTQDNLLDDIGHEEWAKEVAPLVEEEAKLR
ncbi:unnamed protein product, partial [Amoebophrya sp. A25]